MIKQIALMTLTSLLLGGCGLVPLKGGGAATDQKPPQPTATTTPPPTSDPGLDAMPSPGTDTQTTSLETDINSTTILEEDFSDLE